MSNKTLFPQTNDFIVSSEKFICHKSGSTSNCQSNTMEFTPSYNAEKEYEYNFSDGPFFPLNLLPPKRIIKQKEKLLHFSINSRLGVPAGPLLNSRWIKLYSQLGFDLLTYKTVRSRASKAHQFPNCLFLNIKRQIEEEDLTHPLYAFNMPHSPKDREELTITNSFGVPSLDPDKWQPDVNLAKSHLGDGQLLILSVMGTPEDNSNWNSIVEDYVMCAKLAEETNADIIELNLSCPNVVRKEGLIYMDPNLSQSICKKIKKEINKPLFLKIGFLNQENKLEEFMKAVSPFVDGIVAINTIKMRVIKEDATPALPGEKREYSGICGSAIREYAMSQVQKMIDIKQKNKYDLVIVGVGGVTHPKDIDAYLGLGVDAVQSATGAMWDPLLAFNYYTQKS